MKTAANSPTASLPRPSAGYLAGGLPYNRLGRGAQPLVVFQGLQFENKPLGSFSAYFMAGLYRFLAEDYTIYMVGRRPGLPAGGTLAAGATHLPKFSGLCGRLRLWVSS